MRLPRERERDAASLCPPEDESKETVSHYGCLAGVKVDGENVEADVVVIAMGPWIKLATSWFEGIPHIGGQKAHSIVVQPASGSAVTADCLFLAHTTKQGGFLSDWAIHHGHKGVLRLLGQ